MNGMQPQQQPEGMGPRLIIAILLAVVVFVVFQLISPKPQKETIKKKEVVVRSDKDDVKKEANLVSGDSSEKKQTGKFAKKVDKSVMGTIYKKETEKYMLEFSTKGATLKKVLLKKYLDDNKKYMDISPKKDSNALFLSYAGDKTVENYTMIEEGADFITFSLKKDDVEIEKKFLLSKNYDVKLEVKIKNKNKDEVQNSLKLEWDGSLGPFIIEKKRSQYDETLTTSYYDRRESSNEDFDDENIGPTKIDIEWAAIENRYFVMAVIPDKPDVYELYLENTQKIYDEKLSLENDVRISGKSDFTQYYTIYLGPKTEKYLKIYVRKLDTITDRGFAPITLIGKGIKWLLFFINSFIGNFGLAIILVTLVFKVVLHPLTKKSMESTKKMQAMQPQIAALKKKIKDPKELNAKTWELYRREKINPMGGCLPILLQLPFFFALYQVFPYVIELKNAHFLWIKDLSSPDTIAYIDAFKSIPLLPYKLNILPLLLTVFSILQTKVTKTGPAGAGGQGKIMEYMMPMIFLLIFWNLPSGLVLYWLMQTAFTVIHQYIVNKRPIKKKLKKA